MTTALTRERIGPKLPRAVATSVSLHMRILTDIKQLILSGRWSPGHRIPFELDLAKDYACSRMTVNKALTELVRAGLIERRRKAGSFVRAPRSQAALLEIRDLKDEVEELGRTYRFVRLATRQRKASSADRGRLGLVDAGRIMAVTCLHLGSDVPYCVEDRIINLAAVPAATVESFEVVAPGPWLVAHVPWSEAEHRITAMLPDRTSAAHLDIPVSTPCLVVERMTWRASLPLTHVRFTYPGNAREMIARFQPATT